MSFLTSAPISELAIALLRRSIVLPATVQRVPAPEFAGPSGGTVKVRVPRTRTARQQSTPGADITFDAVGEDEVDVTLSHWYSGSLISDEDLTLSIEQFGMQVLMPMVAAIAEQAETTLASEMVMATPTATGDDAATIQWAASPDATSDLATVLAIRERLTLNKTPSANRYLAVSPDIATRLLSVPTFVQADRRGDQGLALDTAVIGQVFGLTVVETPAFPTGTGIGYHASAYAFANVAPAPPAATNADATVASDSGLQLRAVVAFDPGKLSTAAIVSVFAGASIIEDQSAVRRAIKIPTA